MAHSRLLTTAFAILSVSALAGCGGSGSSGPTPPTTQPPVTTPPTTQPPVTAGCTAPLPPPLAGMKLKIQTEVGDRRLLDSKPLVRNDDPTRQDSYCGKVGFDWRAKYCETRPEGDLQREACDALVVGRAKDTGRYGPTWTADDKPCFAAGSTSGQPGCINHADNQFLVIARGPGTYMACAADNVPVDPDGGTRCNILVFN